MCLSIKTIYRTKTSNTADKILLEQRIDGADTEEFNVEVNGEDVYRDFVFNCASQYNELEQCLDELLKFLGVCILMIVTPLLVI